MSKPGYSFVISIKTMKNIVHNCNHVDCHGAFMSKRQSWS